MFKIDTSRNFSTQEKILYNIMEVLQSLVQEDKPPIYEMGRKELVKLIRKLPKGTVKGKWMTFSLDKLREEVERAIS